MQEDISATPSIICQGNQAIHSPPTLNISLQKKKLYAGLVAINNELLVIHQEIDRLSQMEQEFPQQTEIIVSEKKNWEDLQKNLSDTVKGIENELETLYVAHRVNEEKGKKRLEQKKSELQNVIKKTLETSNSKTARLKPKPDKEKS